MRGEDVATVAEAVLALEEPWRGRFLTVIANLATGGGWNGNGHPTREVLVGWLRADRVLRRQVVQLLDAWVRPGEPAGPSCAVVE